MTLHLTLNSESVISLIFTGLYQVLSSELGALYLKI